VALEHTFRTLFAKPTAAALFLIVNGLILLGGERLRRRSAQRTGLAAPLPTGAPTRATVPADAAVPPMAVSGHGAIPAQAHTPVTPVTRPGSRPRRRGLIVEEHRTLDGLAYREAAVIGFFQTFALLAGISRSGITMTAGLLRGLDHEDAARFSFLLATPVILAAG